MSIEPAPAGPERLAFQKAIAGRYSIEHELGRGGMGIVYLAREVALDRLVALKLLPLDMAERPGVRERFLQEARTAARLSHPNIVQIYSVDEVDDFVFFAMAYVDGGTLGDRVRERGPMSNSQVVRLLREVAWALGHAHLNGIVHRDVKPDNILLDHASGRALVTDFGIAVAAEDVDVAASGVAIGTAEFMSPEQARGGSVDARSDLYSLACVGFYALSGQVPFSHDSAADILLRHIGEPPPPLRSLAPHAPPAMASALDRCLRKDPDQRFQRGEALADALRPEMETDRDLPVPLRVFIKQSREFETTLAYCGLGLSFLLPLWLVVIFDQLPFDTFLGLVGATTVLAGIPVLHLARAARKLLSSGYVKTDAITGFGRDIERREEEYRFQVGERVTLVDRLARAVKYAGFAVAGLGIVAEAILPGYNEAALLATGIGLPTGTGGLLLQEARARLRGDVMGERLRRLWKGTIGDALFKLAGVRLRRVAPALAGGVHRPTEVVIGLEADRLFEALPRETRRELAGLPEIVRRLEEDAQAMRREAEGIEALLAELGDDDPSRPQASERAGVRAKLEATRDDAANKLRQAVAALEKIRLDLLYMQAGTQELESLTVELSAARALSDDVATLLAGQRAVERLLQQKRETGVIEWPKEWTVDPLSEPT